MKAVSLWLTIATRYVSNSHLTLSRYMSISRSPPPAMPPANYLPQRAIADPYVDDPPKLFVDQPDTVTSTGDPPVQVLRVWSDNPKRNRRMKKMGYLKRKSREAFGPPLFIHPGDELKSPKQFLDPVVWHNAALLVDKPKRWTSSDICGRLRNATFRYPFKVGHAGTLDPLATGLLIVCMGTATKTVGKFVALDKEYSGTLKLGETTISHDASEPVSHRKQWNHITDAQIEEAAGKLTGKLKMKPPMFSAVKKDGTRLYEYAKLGLEIERDLRVSTVMEFRVKRPDPTSPVVHYAIKCSSGTYVRSLVHKLGGILRCGAYVRSLRRDAIGSYKLSDAWELDKLLQVIKDSKLASQ